ADVSEVERLIGAAPDGCNGSVPRNRCERLSFRQSPKLFGFNAAMHHFPFAGGLEVSHGRAVHGNTFAQEPFEVLCWNNFSYYTSLHGWDLIVDIFGTSRLDFLTKFSNDFFGHVVFTVACESVLIRVTFFESLGQRETLWRCSLSCRNCR